MPASSSPPVGPATPVALKEYLKTNRPEPETSLRKRSSPQALRHPGRRTSNQTLSVVTVAVILIFTFLGPTVVEALSPPKDCGTSRERVYSCCDPGSVNSTGLPSDRE